MRCPGRIEENGSGQKTLPKEHKLMLTPQGQNTDFQTGKTKYKQGIEARNCQALRML